MPRQLPPDSPLRQIAETWVKKLEQGLKYKKPFSDDAKEAMSFFDGPHNWMWRNSYARGENGYTDAMAPPAFRMQCNKVFECVKLFASVIYHRNPVRTVTPTKYPIIDPQILGVEPPAPGEMPSDESRQMLALMESHDQQEVLKNQIGKLISAYLNYTPDVLNLKDHSRMVVDEGMIKGMGVWWTELVELDGGGQGERPVRMVGSFYDTIDNLVIDGDFDEMENMQWCARRCVHPIETVAGMYGIDPDELRPHIDGSRLIRTDNEIRDQRKRAARTNELVTYWKIWSKTGFGDRLKDAPKESKGVFDGLGKYTYIVICEGVPYPLNVPPDVLDEEVDEQTGLPPSLLERTAWPVPYYTEHNGWPFTPLAFHKKPNYAWPISHIKPGIGELRFLNFALSWMATRIATASETLVGVSKAAEQDFKDQLLAPSQGGFKLLEISETLGRSISDLVSVFNLPGVSKDMWDIINAVMELFDKRTGLTELVYGQTNKAYRSAAEAQIKQENVSIRPDDMYNCLESAMSTLGRREALAARWLLEPEDVTTSLGPIGAIAWGKYVSSRSVTEITKDFHYRVEAGSSRKPNKATRVEQMQSAVQMLGPVLQQLIPAGLVDPFNALIRDWADSMDIDPTEYFIPPPPPPPPAPPPGLLPPDGMAAEGAGGEPPPSDLPPDMTTEAAGLEPEPAELPQMPPEFA